MTTKSITALQVMDDQAELYRLMKYNVLALLNGSAANPLVISFTSCRAREGVSTQAVNFAQALSQDHSSRVLLVDFNYKRPSLHRFFPSNEDEAAPQTGQTAEAGATAEPAPRNSVQQDNVLIRDKKLVRSSNRLDVVVSSRRSERCPDSLHNIENVDLFFETAKQHYNYILIDSPPLQGNSLAHMLASRADYTVLVVKAHGVNRLSIKDKIAQLNRLGANLLGVILNKREYPIPGWIYRLLCGGSR